MLFRLFTFTSPPSFAMKEKITDEIREIILHIKEWISAEVMFAKLTVTEKLTILMGSVMLAAVSFVLLMIAFVIISLCLVQVFEPLVGQPLAFLCVGGIFLVLLVLVILLRKPLIYNPVAKMLSKLIIEKK